MATQTIVNRIKNNIWYEKYRPKSLDELTLPEFYRKKFTEYINNPPFPHLMFIGLPGSGKTTIAKIMIRNIIKHEHDVKIVNGSGLGVDSLRIDPSNPTSGELIQFALKRPVKSPCKILLIDEFDNASRDFYMRFRSEVEKISQVSKTVIIATCNRINFDTAILQRFQEFYFSTMPLEEMKSQVFNILNQEGVQYNEQVVESIVEMLYPSMRWILQTLQKYTVDNVLQEAALETIDVNNRLIQLATIVINSKSFERKEFNELVQLLRSKSHLIMSTYFIKKIEPLLSPEGVIILAKHANNISNALHVDIAIQALIADIVLNS